MSNVMMPQAKQPDNRLGKALMLGGAIAGGVTAGPGAGAVLRGIGSGAGLGSTGSALLSMGQKQKSEVPSVQSGGADAMQRRMASMQTAQSNIRALRDAETALAAVPPAQAQQYAPTIKRARTLAETEIA